MPRAGQRKWLTHEQERIVREAYAGGATCREAAFLAGVSVSVMTARLLDQVRDLRRGRGRGGRRGPAVDPTPAQIDERARQCRERLLRIMRPKFHDATNLD
jgi:transposase-like protein